MKRLADGGRLLTKTENLLACWPVGSMTSGLLVCLRRSSAG